MAKDLPPDIPPDIQSRMWSPEEEPRPTPPSPEQQQEAWHLVERLWRESTERSREYDFLAGAVAAARWTSQWTAEPPLTQGLKLAEGAAVFWEAAEADMVEMGQRPGVNIYYARGAGEWLDWFRGQADRPHWLR